MREYKARFYDFLRRKTSYKTRKWFKDQSWFTPLAKICFGNAVYGSSYYEELEHGEKKSAEIIASFICNYFNPNRIVDIGCGPGHFMFEFHKRKVDVYGVDISQEAIKRVYAKKMKADIIDLAETKSNISNIPFDLAICFEVAEHIDQRFVDIFLKKITDAAPLIFMTTAKPDAKVGKGIYHVNEQPEGYWVSLLEKYGFILDKQATDAARKKLRVEEVVSYLQEPMIFRSCLAMQG